MSLDPQEEKQLYKFPDGSQGVIFKIFEPWKLETQWIYFSALTLIASSILGAFLCVLSCWGILLLWLFSFSLWSGFYLYKAARSIDRGLKSAQRIDLRQSSDSLGKWLFTLGLFYLFGLILMILAGITALALVIYSHGNLINF